jgi:glutamine---fructose-6-phosphate transaminase (isomerizing)
MAAIHPLPSAPDPWAASTMPAFRARPPYVMTEMIAAEPALAERLSRRLSGSDVVRGLVADLRAVVERDEPIVATGCGTSEHAAAAIAALLNETLRPRPGREVRSVQALEFIRRPLDRGLLLAVSHEGGTTATNDALAAARGAGARTALITVSDRSPGAAIADTVVTTDEQDASWCHTVGYLSPLVAGAVLAWAVAGARPDPLAIRALLEVAIDARAAADVAAGLATVDRVIVTGSGIDHVSARELALKIAEGARVPTAALELETVLHGHLAAATRWTGLVVIATDDEPPTEPFRSRVRDVLAAASALHLPTAAILGESAARELSVATTPAGRLVLPHTGRVPGVAGSLFAAAVALQLLTERLARARNVNPDTLGREDPAQAAAHA